MAKETVAPENDYPASAMDGAESDDWETVATGLGREWDFDRDGALIGNFLGVQVVETTKVDSGEASAYLFRSNAGEDVFVWGSSEIEKAFARTIPDTDTPIIAIGDRVRVEFLGRESFTGAKGPQQIKRFRVQIPKAGSPRV